MSSYYERLTGTQGKTLVCRTHLFNHKVTITHIAYILLDAIQFYIAISILMYVTGGALNLTIRARYYAQYTLLCCLGITIYALPSIIVGNIYLQLLYLLPTILMANALALHAKQGTYFKAWGSCIIITPLTLCYLSYLYGDIVTHCASGTLVIVSLFFYDFKRKNLRIGLRTVINYYGMSARILTDDDGFSASINHGHWILTLDKYEKTGEYDWEFHNILFDPNNEDEDWRIDRQ